MKALMCCSW